MPEEVRDVVEVVGCVAGLVRVLLLVRPTVVVLVPAPQLQHADGRVCVFAARGARRRSRCEERQESNVKLRVHHQKKKVEN
jgi:LmbE family N-acetylglucosaminyl deacetylase